MWALLDGCGIGPLAASASAGWLLDETSREAFALPGALFGDNGAGPSAMLTLYSTMLTLSKPYHRLGILPSSPTFPRSASILTTALFTMALLTMALLTMALLTVGLLWTGLATTALVRVGETAGLTKVPQ